MEMFNNNSNSTCTSKETFSKFGVAGGDNRFFESEGYNNVSGTTFAKQLMNQTNTYPLPFYCKSRRRIWTLRRIRTLSIL